MTFTLFNSIQRKKLQPLNQRKAAKGTENFQKKENLRNRKFRQVSPKKSTFLRENAIRGVLRTAQHARVGVSDLEGQFSELMA